MSLRKRLIYLLSGYTLWFFHFFIVFRKLMSQRSSIVTEVIGTVYLFIYLFYKDILHKNTHKLCSNILIRLKSIIKHTSNFHSDITPRSIIKHTSNFHLDITPRSIKNNFSFKYFYTLKKAHKQLSFRYYA